MSKYAVALLLIIVVILLAGLGFFIFQNQKLIQTLSNPTPSPQMPESTSSATPITTQTPTMTLQQLKENIEVSTNSGNTQALGTYMTSPKVNFTLMSTECCEPQTPDEAISQMEYVKDGLPLDFNQNNPTIVNLKAKNPQLKDTFIGISKTKEHLASFTIDANNKISKIQLSISWKLYEQ